MVLCLCDGILTSEEEVPIYIGCERRVVLIDVVVTFDVVESQVRHINESGSSLIKIMYSLK